MHLPTRRRSRRAAALVEFAFIAVVLVLILFGILEYGRFLFMMQVATNAAREGARYAVVHTGDGTTKQQVIDEVTNRMAGRKKELEGFDVKVLNVNPDTGVEVANSSWDQTTFGNSIEIQITGVYHPMLPTFLKTATGIPVKVTAMMSSEAN